MKYILEVSQGPNSGKTFSIEQGENLIGRWDPDSASFPEIDMTNDDQEAKISRKHAVIIFDENLDLTFVDLGSLNGSYLKSGDGPEIKLEQGKQQQITEGDELVIGKTVLRVRKIQSAE